MNEDSSSCVQADADIETLLQAYAGGEMFGDPPDYLVERAISSIAQPCYQRSLADGPKTAQRALIVLSLAAAAVAIAVTSNPNKRTPAVAEIIQPSHAAASVQPEREPRVTLAAAGNVSAPTKETAAWRPARPPHHRDRALVSPPKATWTESVVTADEQGIVVPVVTVASRDDGEQEVSPGAEVVPINSGVTYTDYTEDGGS